MKTRGRWCFLLLGLSAVLLSGCAAMNSYKKEGSLPLPGLKERVTVL
ncbi:MAG: hypothetical protein JRJ18_12490, partial [Deltaproteobacteria bacterium]|nr:hypothetical protein [Deltaproteobacteria bacterium]MBW2008892.1 hypothetical protein [Deltaproteobacteria bacterium]